MKKTIGIVLAGVLTLSSAGLLAESNIGVLDMDKVVSDSSQAKQIKTDMEKQFAPQKEKITTQNSYPKSKSKSPNSHQPCPSGSLKWCPRTSVRSSENS